MMGGDRKIQRIPGLNNNLNLKNGKSLQRNKCRGTEAPQVLCVSVRESHRFSREVC